MSDIFVHIQVVHSRKESNALCFASILFKSYYKVSILSQQVMAFPSDIVKSVKEELAKRHLAQSIDSLTKRNLAEGLESLTKNHETRGVDPKACMGCMNNALTMNQSDMRQVCGYVTLLILQSMSLGCTNCLHIAFCPSFS